MSVLDKSLCFLILEDLTLACKEELMEIEGITLPYLQFTTFTTLLLSVYSPTVLEEPFEDYFMSLSLEISSISILAIHTIDLVNSLTNS
jgi:hypothetical protein